MNRTIQTSFCAAIAACATVALAAQTPTSQTPTPQSGAANADKTITITGCLKEAPSSTPASSTTTATPTPPPGAAGSAGDAAAGQNYILTNATTSTASSSTSSTTGTTGTAGTGGTTAGTTGTPADASGSSAAGQTYRLIANPTALTPHVGKKLELTGTLETQGSSTPSSPSTTASDANALMNAPTLRVTGGKIVAPSCQ